MNTEKYLFFDTETNGRVNPKTKKWTNEQHIIELAYMVTDENFNEIFSKSCMIKDVANKIYPGQSVYTYSDILKGENWEDTYYEFLDYINKVVHNNGYLIAHNLNFDKDAIIFSCEEMKMNKKSIDTFEKNISTNGFCTMKSTVSYCKLPGFYGNYKWPKLEELYNKTHPNNPFIQTHKAMDDVNMLVKCFKKCKKYKVFKF